MRGNQRPRPISPRGLAHVGPKTKASVVDRHRRSTPCLHGVSRSARRWRTSRASGRSCTMRPISRASARWQNTLMCDDSPDYSVTIPAKTGPADAYLDRPARRAAVTGSILSGSAPTPDGPKGGGPRRGGERGPRARSGPGGGGRLRPYRKAYPHGTWYATTGVRFDTGGVSPQVPSCSVSPIELQHMPQGLRRVYRQIATVR
jgi:hypothetical protein